MTLWDVLSLICFAMPIGGADAVARKASVGFGMHALAVVVGVLVGVASTFALRSIGDVVAKRLETHQPCIRENSLRLYFAAFVWAISGTFVGGWAVHLMIRAAR